MGLLDSLLGAAHDGGGGPGGNAALIDMVLGLVTGGSGQGGDGLEALVEQFQRAGLGDVVGSWVSTGQNVPIAPDQLGGVLGRDTISGMASQLGMNQGDLLAQLAHLLPQVVDKLTPHGQVPQRVDAAGLDLGGLLGSLLRR